ncbi:hypothetical protein LS70_009560 [Helicobacter sp. MIT 11-5569]|uniref:hypothetical protein n=1 Tax=Helicobacter sp. MIT 11-5569 TaxID=1548151 RepID=UPI00051FC602|nr:hypothetical protein [Helicobacter sp. MIT 11-5569]TLD79872.1 hypothetical protein LS70_009560 [Helicobacter sp. MIT 11-5569]
MKSNTDTQDTLQLSMLKRGICEELDKRVEDRILEKENAELLQKLINKAESIQEAQSIAALGTTWKRTGFHFDKRLEKQSNDIAYLERNEDLSFNASTCAGGGNLIVA